MRIEKKWAVKNAPNKLSDNQMKHVVAGYGEGGGYESSSQCAPGEKKYYCTSSCGNGSCCATSASNAKKKTEAAQCMYYDPGTCPCTYSCS